MEKKYLFAIILLIILLALVGVSSGKFQELLVRPFQEGINWESECIYWATSGCSTDKVPLKLTAAINKESNICKELACGGENAAGCKCGIKSTTDDLINGKNLYCCASKDGGKVYGENNIEECENDCAGGDTPHSEYLVWSKCCQALPTADLKSSCRCSN